MNNEKLAAIFQKWEDGDYNKWDAYGKAFAMMDAGECTLLNIMDAAHRIGIPPGVVHMRRNDHLTWKLEREQRERVMTND
jgi:hypothetical protein|tara:strand:+ start:190 stop:429 length:240 start_codon:yes stop_codon:yes gene_type:complete